MTPKSIHRNARLFAGIFTFLLLAQHPVHAQNDESGFEFAIDHVGISVANLEESVDWYVEMLGFELMNPINSNPDSVQNIARVRKGEFIIELFQIEGAAPLPEYRRDPSADLRVHGLAHFAFQVEDAAAAKAELEAKGVEIVFDRGNFFFVADNSGNTFEFIQR